ncbi:hypothetical protein NLI96_g5847 [Meripilus lineatus]|uniref:HMG box domain-containing protein n=1 Tax=Meripilus lineatus TaxID=2056292 RepID=A0AAD5V7K7_9APHY|nr:hypothetical protein NLI96_g5847 [Physisporinus lineatus]
MPVSPIFRRDRDQDALALSLAASDMSLADHSPLMSFDDSHPYDYGLSDSTHMIFDFDDGSAFDSKSPISPWDPSNTPDYSISNTIPLFPASPESTSSELGNISSAHLSPSDRSFDPSLILSYPDVHHNHPHQQPHHHQHHHQQQQQDFADNSLYSNWITDPDAQNLHHIHNTSAPIDIPTSHQSAHSSQLNSFVAYSDKSIFPDVSVLSPNTAFASLQPLPRSYSPSPQAVDTIMTDVLQDTSSMSPPDYTHSPPTWAQQLWSQPSQPAPPPDPSPLSSVPFPAAPEDAYATQRPRLRRDIRSVSQMWQSSSAPSLSHARPPLYSRAYSRRAESISSHQDDRDATIRTSKKRRSPAVEEEEARPAERERESPPLKSTLKPPKLAPSAWQLYFTDWIQRHQASSHKKLNVAQAAKEAGQEYARLSSEEKEPYKRRSLAAKEARERELAAYMRTLTPDDIKRENAFRTAQRKAGKSRKGNIKDPNAPKKPLSAYFMFLQRIRSDAVLVREVFGEETETTKQSVLAAAKWRSMTDDERKPFLAQAEQEKLEYEAARKLYEEGTTGYSSSINFSILPGSPINAIAFPSSSSSLSSSLSKLAASSTTMGAGNSMITTPMTMQGTLVKQEMTGSESESDGSGL